MKPKLLLLTLTGVLLFGVNAQAQWNLTGNAIGSTDFLGSTNQQDLNFRTFNLQRVTIKGLNNHPLSTANNEGFVGIGMCLLQT